MKAIRFVALALTMSALATASPALAKSKRASSETGPLMMSGTLVPASMAARSRASEICRPVTIKRELPTSAVSWRYR
jgi:hypothetical protein